ncbi:antibiotic biosynthesis monooxygenase family protein [Couchioplanes azureus]|uniref:antibiotic biosynthesis monooxygenase family protein n=1 Tax=Couchioplanes caeruleus TaxID=56438 RepID=UPI0016716C5A|nr:antibiotic biosynthesis monooxygenase family protein [Couchioplanes caeruleus]GGQ86092.1 hypothetical protein GCM10010166_65360 [Couchioplanes caeruleus subsp. azureus]
MADRDIPVTGGEGVVFVNRFTVQAQPEHFERIFADTSAYFARQPGFVRHTLVRHVDQPGAYVNIAQWRDASSLRQAVAHPDFGPHAAALRAISTSDPNLYEVCQHQSVDQRAPEADRREGVK